MNGSNRITTANALVEAHIPVTEKVNCAVLVVRTQKASILYSEHRTEGATVGSSRLDSTLASSSDVAFAIVAAFSLEHLLGVCGGECGEAKTVVGATVCTCAHSAAGMRPERVAHSLESDLGPVHPGVPVNLVRRAENSLVLGRARW
jgi:hypothetical protein